MVGKTILIDQGQILKWKRIPSHNHRQMENCRGGGKKAQKLFEEAAFAREWTFSISMLVSLRSHGSAYFEGDGFTFSSVKCIDLLFFFFPPPPKQVRVEDRDCAIAVAAGHQFRIYK